MSYILDALKKSEQERTQGRVETLDAVSREASDGRLKFALLGVFLVGMLSVLAIAAFWYFRAEVSHKTPGGQPDQIAAEQARQPAVFDSTRMVGAIGSTQPDAAETPRAQNNGGDATQVRVTAMKSGSRQPVPLVQLPAQLRASLPPLQISVLSYAEDPDRRFVMLDGKILKEQEYVHSNLLLHAIESERLILGYKNHKFFIVP